jgi:hypothetical protein
MLNENHRNEKIIEGKRWPCQKKGLHCALAKIGQSRQAQEKLGT